MNVEDEIRELVAKLEKAKAAGAFKTFIDSIRFPNYRSLAPNATIRFDFPLTALVGQNGTGKTSVIQALYGSPGWMSVEDFWFSTDVDPIKGEDPPVKGKRRKYEGIRPSLVYTYEKDGHTASVLKYRILKKDKPDYWEPARPGPTYGLASLKGNRRHPTISMDVIHRNFRYLPTSFDRCFHFLDLKKLPLRFRTKHGIRTRQDYLRYKSQFLKKVLESGKAYYVAGNRLSHAPVNITPADLATIGSILGKSYSQGTVVNHRFFEREGESVIFRAGRVYSEAYAGSGESAVVSLVRDISRAKNGSLVLLDEPEVSLHPGAQQQVVRFLLKQALTKKLQIVISTHSPSMIRGLPRTAIKLFSESSDDGLVRVTEGLAPEEAFFAIGYPHSDKITILVEDALAKLLLESVAEDLEEEKRKLLDIRFNAGGASAIVHDIAYYSRHAVKNAFVVFDGDRRMPHYDYSSAPVADLTVDKLQEQIKKQTREDLAFAIDGKGGQGNQAQKLEAQKAYLDFFLKNVFYLPGNAPEDIVWDPVGVEKLLDSVSVQNPADVAKDLGGISDPKERFQALSEKAFAGGNAAAVRDFLVKRWAHQRPQSWTDVRDTLESIRTKYA